MGWAKVAIVYMQQDANYAHLLAWMLLIHTNTTSRFYSSWCADCWSFFRVIFERQKCWSKENVEVGPASPSRVFSRCRLKTCWLRRCQLVRNHPLHHDSQRSNDFCKLGGLAIAARKAETSPLHEKLSLKCQLTFLWISEKPLCGDKSGLKLK